MATAHKMGIQSVACYSDADRHSMHVAMVSTKACWKNPKILINLLRERNKKRKNWKQNADVFIPVNIYLFKNDNRNTRKRFDISSSKLKLRRSDVFIVNFEHISHFFLVFILLSLSSVVFGGMCIPVTKEFLKVNTKLRKCTPLPFCFFEQVWSHWNEFLCDKLNLIHFSTVLHSYRNQSVLLHSKPKYMKYNKEVEWVNLC